MNITTKHTPTPNQMDKEEFTAHCVDCHDELIKALESAYEYIMYRGDSDAAKKINATIAKAKGETCSKS